MLSGPQFFPSTRSRLWLVSIDRALDATAQAQFGLISRRQASAGGLSLSNINYRLASGRWVRVLPGVYRLAGTPITSMTRLMAASLWGRGTSAVSHRSAARILRLDGVKEDLVELSILGRANSPADWLLLHYPQALPSDEIETVNGMRVTSAARTLLDLGAVVPRWRVEVALDGALRDRIADYKALREVLERHGARGRDGTAALRYLLVERDPDYVPPASRLERTFARVLNEPRLPKAVRQYPIVRAGRIVYRLDFAYPEWRVAIEIDSYRHHYGRQSWHKDRTRSNAVTALGWRLLRFTKEEARAEAFVVDCVLTALERAGYSCSSST